jgi:hypothetical protein
MLIPVFTLMFTSEQNTVATSHLVEMKLYQVAH